MKTFAKFITIDVPSIDVLLIVNNDKDNVMKVIDDHIKNTKERNNTKRDIKKAMDEWIWWCYVYVKKWFSRILLLTWWKDNWEHWDYLNHEINHLVEYEADERWFHEEKEFKAHLQEWLFRKFRDILKYKWK